jgi:DnaJ-class molecular chaperone
MPRGRTHYQILGLTRDASSIDIASAVRDKLAELKGEPGSEGQADEVREAYQVLANPHSRAEYDAGLPPDRAQLAARQAASRGPGPIAFVMEVLREAGVVKVGIGAVVLAMATIIWFKTRPAIPGYAAE